MYVCMYVHRQYLCHSLPISYTSAAFVHGRTPQLTYGTLHAKLTDVHCICTQSPGSPSVLDMPARSLREQGDFATAQPRAREAEFLAPGLRVSAFDCGEVLREARGDVGCFCEGELFCPFVQRSVYLNESSRSKKIRKEGRKEGRKEERKKERSLGHLRPMQILGPPLKGRYSHPTLKPFFSP